MSIRVAILGAAGRMGRTLARCLHEGAVDELLLTAVADRSELPEAGCDIGELAGFGATGLRIGSDLEAAAAEADVLIDFSFHTATAVHARGAAEAGKPMVIGTTGLTDDERAIVREAATRIPIVMAPNMSLGVNLLFALAEQAAQALQGKGYDVEIIERHHRLKKDAPSGTALGLGEAVARGLGQDLDRVAVHGRHGISPAERSSDEIGFHAIRGGDIIGDHNVVFAADGELVELTHRATSRDTFAVGALRAARWCVGQAPGLYDMQDVLGLRRS